MTQVILDREAIRSVERKAYKCLGLTAKVLQDEIRQAQVIPRDVGTLQGEAFVVDTSTEQKGYVRMSFNTPYARRLYFHPEYNFRHDQNPNAQGLWLRSWQKGGKKEKRPADIFEKLLKKEL